MKNSRKYAISALASLVGSLLLIVSLPVSAASYTALADCKFPPDHAITDANSDIVGCIKDAAWREAMANSSQTLIGALPRFFAGQVVTDEHGVSYSCNNGVGMELWACTNLTKSPTYKAYMEANARELIARGLDRQFPQFAGWVNSVRK